jgi:hypothetical protein
VHEQDERDQHQDAWDHEPESLLRGGERFVLPTPREARAVASLDGPLDGRLGFHDDVAELAPADVEAKHHASLTVVAKEHGRRRLSLDGRDALEGNRFALRTWHQGRREQRDNK